jgi:hypothetical protein
MIAEMGEVPALPDVQPFADNWSYLKAELAWLDRVLMRSLSKQRQTNQELDRVSKSPIDRSTSHWWKGFIAIDPSKGGSLVPKQPPQNTHPLGRYGDRLFASREQDIRLAIPSLCDRLELGKFERDVLILCLAPEISRRYERIYEFLNNDNGNCKQPTVDLALRLFCHSDAEWRSSRVTLAAQAPLIKRKIIQLYLPTTNTRSLLSKAMLLSEKAVSYLLSEDLSIDTVIPKPRAKK